MKMGNIKYLGILLVLALLGCAKKNTSFRVASHFDTPGYQLTDAGFLTRLFEYHDDPIAKVLRVDVYQATIREIIIFNNEYVSDYQLTNTLSDYKDPGFGDRYRYEMYFYVFCLERKRAPVPKYCGLLTSQGFGHKMEKQCDGGWGPTIRSLGTGVGYAGELSLDDNENTILIASGKKLKVYPDQFLKRVKKSEINMRFFTGSSLRPKDGLTFSPPNHFCIEKVILGGGNKISGAKKMLQFEIEDVFKDENFLKFKFLKTWTSSPTQ